LDIILDLLYSNATNTIDVIGKLREEEKKDAEVEKKDDEEEKKRC
jgi:hypothetical protein